MVIESKKRASKKYDSKTYKKISIALRIEEDSNIIEGIEKARENNVPLREWLSTVYNGGTQVFSPDCENFISKRMKEGQSREEVIAKAMAYYTETMG